MENLTQVVDRRGGPLLMVYDLREAKLLFILISSF